MGLFDWLSGTPSRDKFASALLKAIRGADKTADVAYDRHHFRLVGEAGKGWIMCLEKAYAEFCAANSAKRPGVLKKCVATFMGIIILCPRCRGIFRASTDLLGNKAECSRCGTVFTVSQFHVIDQYEAARLLVINQCEAATERLRRAFTSIGAQQEGPLKGLTGRELVNGFWNLCLAHHHAHPMRPAAGHLIVHDYLVLEDGSILDPKSPGDFRTEVRPGPALLVRFGIADVPEEETPDRIPLALDYVVPFLVNVPASFAGIECSIEEHLASLAKVTARPSQRQAEALREFFRKRSIYQWDARSRFVRGLIG